MIRAFISYQNIQEKSIILENSLKIWPKSQAEALATELPIKKNVYLPTPYDETHEYERNSDTHTHTHKHTHTHTHAYTSTLFIHIGVAVDNKYKKTCQGIL